MNFIHQKINNFISHPFVKDTAVLQVGNVLGTIISILSAVLIARLLQPEKYGLYSLIFAFAGLISLFINLGAEKATIILFSEAYAKKDKEKIKEILTYFLKINMLIFFTVGLALILLAPVLSKYFYHSIEIGNLTRLIILTNFLGLFFGIITVTFQVLRQMMNYAVIDNLNTLLKSILSILFVVWGLGVFGVVIGQLMAAILILIISIAFYGYLTKKNDYLPTLADLFLNFGRVSVKKYFKFGFLIALDENINSLYGYLPMVFLGAFAATNEIAYLKIAFKYVSLPLILLGPVGQLLNIQLPATKISGYESLKRNFIKVTVYSFLISVVLMSILILLAPFLVGFFYGQSYLPSIKLIYYSAVFVAFSSLAVGLGAMFRTLNLMRVAIIINASVILLGLPIVFWSIRTYGVMGAVFAISGWPLIADIINYLYLLNFLNKTKIISK